MIICIMKKGQKVRIKSSGKIGVIADSEFFVWGRVKHVRYEVKVDGEKSTCWYPKESLTINLVESATIVFSGENGTLNMVISFDHEKNDGIHAELTGNPENLQEHRGLYVNLATALINRLFSNS